MSTTEYFAESILIEGNGIHALTWQDKGDLVRALIVFLSVLGDLPLNSILLTSLDESERELKSLFDIRPIEDAEYASVIDQPLLKRETFLLLFLDQAVSTNIGPLLNGWRSALAEPPGTLLAIRSADFIDFQRNAPDLASFIGPRIFDTSTMLHVWSVKTAQKIKARIPAKISTILSILPGDDPSGEEIEMWISAHPPVEDAEDIQNEGA